MKKLVVISDPFPRTLDLIFTKSKLKELRSKYLFTLIYCFLEKILLNKKK